MHSNDLHDLVDRAVRRAIRRERRRALVTLVALSLVATLTWTARTWAQTSCAQTLPAPLVTFCPDAPAIAPQVNGNFQALASAVIARTGSLTATTGALAGADVTVSSAGKRAFTDGQDFVLDSTAARGGNTTGQRRALSHTAGDVLSLNASGDYTGGTLVTGSLRVTGAISSGCPTSYPQLGGAVSMFDMGAYCITTTPPAGLARGTVTWLDANDFCVSRGLRMCHLAEVSAAVRANRVTSGTTGELWAWIDETASDTNTPGFGGCHVAVTPPGGSIPGDVNCGGVSALAVHPAIAGLCCL